MDARLSPRLRTIACMVFLFGVNALMCRELFHLEYTSRLGSVEALFISFSKWMMDHWHDRSWIPMWMDGIPARQVYGPGLHTAVAQLALWTGWTAQHAHHFITACTYSLGPVTLFWLIYRTTQRRGAALFAGLFYSLVSPSLFLFETFRLDVGSYLDARRYQNLIVYGEGPHVTDLMMIPLVLWMIEEAASAKRWVFVFLAPIALACLVLTNWTGTTGFAMALSAYVLSKWGAGKYGERRLHWPTFIGIGVIAYMLASPWVPPSLIKTMQIASSQLSPQLPFGPRLKVAIAFAAVLLAAHFILRRFRVDPWTRFFAYFALISGGIVTCDTVLNRPLIPIGYRFQLELEMAIAGLIALVATSIGARLPRTAQRVLIGVLLVVGFLQGRNYRHYMRYGTTAIDHTTTEEYKMSKWIDAHLHDQRVFVPGNLSEWMNLYNGVWQVVGCCDQSVLANEYRMAVYVIYSGDGAGDRDGEISTMWLRLYGASAVAVQSTVTTQIGQPYRNIRKFDGVLKELWRDGESVVYSVPYSGLAHVIPETAMPSRHPVNGVDMEPFVPLINAMERPSERAELQWMNQHEFEISADTGPRDVIFVQQTFDEGWHAYEGSDELPLRVNVLGLTTVEGLSPGHHKIHMIYSGDTEDRIVNAAFWIGAVLLVLWTYRRATT